MALCKFRPPQTCKFRLALTRLARHLPMLASLEFSYGCALLLFRCHFKPGQNPRPPSLQQIAAGKAVLHCRSGRAEFVSATRRKLTVLISPGKPLQGRRTPAEWFKAVAALVEDEERYPETGGRGPFWELFRYGMTGATSGPVVCAKLVADFDAWEEAVKSVGKDKFFEYHLELRRCFAHAGESGMVAFPFRWTFWLTFPPMASRCSASTKRGSSLSDVVVATPLLTGVLCGARFSFRQRSESRAWLGLLSGEPRVWPAWIVRVSRRPRRTRGRQRPGCHLLKQPSHR